MRCNNSIMQPHPIIMVRKMESAYIFAYTFYNMYGPCRNFYLKSLQEQKSESTKAACFIFSLLTCHALSCAFPLYLVLTN